MPLTERERDVLLLLCDGLRVREMAQHLGISSKTIEYHTQSIREKWGIKRIALIVRKSIREGIINA